MYPLGPPPKKKKIDCRSLYKASRQGATVGGGIPIWCCSVKIISSLCLFVETEKSICLLYGNVFINTCTPFSGKVVHLNFGHNLCKCRPIFKNSFTASCINIEISISPELRCYTTLWNLKIQNNCWTNASIRENVPGMFYTKLSKLNKVCSTYAAKYHRYDLLNFHDIHTA